MYVCSRTRTNVKKKGRESERLKQQKKKLLINIKKTYTNYTKNDHAYIYICAFALIELRC